MQNPETWRQIISLNGKGSLKRKRKSHHHIQTWCYLKLQTPQQALSPYLISLHCLTAIWLTTYLFIVSPTGTWTPWRQVFLFVLFRAVSSISRNMTDTVKALNNFVLNKWIHPSQRKRLDSHNKLYGKIPLLSFSL